MNQILDLSAKYFKVIIIKKIQQAITNSPETNEEKKIEVNQRNRNYKKRTKWKL